MQAHAICLRIRVLNNDEGMWINDQWMQRNYIQMNLYENCFDRCGLRLCIKQTDSIRSFCPSFGCCLISSPFCLTLICISIDWWYAYFSTLIFSGTGMVNNMVINSGLAAYLHHILTNCERLHTNVVLL